MARNFPANPQDGDLFDGFIYNLADEVWNLESSTYATESYVDSRTNAKISNSQKGAPLGVATLDGDGYVEMTQLDHIMDSAPSTLNTFGKLAAQFNTKTTTQWAASTGVLPSGSINVEIDNGNGTVKFKIGNGSESFQDLSYVTDAAYVDTLVAQLQLQINALEDGKASLSGAVFSGTVEFEGSVIADNATSIAGATGTEISYLSGVTSDIQTQLNLKFDTSNANGLAPINSPTFTGNVSLPYETTIGNLTSAEINSLDGVSTSLTVQYQIDELSSDVTTVQSGLASKAPINSPTFTGTVTGITKAMVGLGNVDNTSDANKPIPNAVQIGLDGKANLSGADFTGDVTAPNLTLSGDLYVGGTTTTVSSKNYTVRDNMIYMNQAGLFDIEDAVGNGTTVTYTAPNHNYEAGDYIYISGIVPTEYNIPSSSFMTIDSVSGDTFVVTKSDTGVYISGGVARGKSAANPDLGIAAGYNDGTYHHTGFFRDATDGYWKVFDGYTPEPDSSPFIDTSHSSFELADLQASDIKPVTLTFPDGSIQSTAGIPSATGFIYKTASYTLDDLGLKDNVIEVDSTSATTITIPLDSAIDYPIGTSMDILQTNTGQVTIAATVGVTMNGTPGFKLRTRWSSATILKRAANTWIVYGDLAL